MEITGIIELTNNWYLSFDLHGKKIRFFSVSTRAWLCTCIYTHPQKVETIFQQLHTRITKL